MLGNKDLVPVFFREHAAIIKVIPSAATCGPSSTSAHKLRQFPNSPYSGSGVSFHGSMESQSASGHGRPVEFIRRQIIPSQSLPLSVNHNSPVSGFQAKPTVFAYPSCKISGWLRQAPYASSSHSVLFLFEVADIARHTDRHIQLSIRSELYVFQPCDLSAGSLL